MNREQGQGDPNAAAIRDAVAAVRGGDRDAFARIVALHQRRLFGLALMITRDASGAEEVTQDAFVRAFMHLDTYDAHRPFYPWISTIAVRLAQNWLVQHTRITSREGAAIDSDRDPSGGADPLAGLIASESDRRVWALVAALPSGERTAVILYYRQEMSVGEIARAVGVATGTVKTLLFRARQRLRGRLADPQEQDEDSL